jgi:hypothetical protein
MEFGTRRKRQNVQNEYGLVSQRSSKQAISVSYEVYINLTDFLKYFNVQKNITKNTVKVKLFLCLNN